MKKENIIFYTLSLFLLAYLTVKYESALSAFFGYIISVILIYGLGKNISEWLDKAEQKKEKEPL